MRGQIDSRNGERVLCSFGNRDGLLRVLLRESDQILQSQDAHRAEVGGGVLALEADLLPRVGDPQGPRDIGFEEGPKGVQLGLVGGVGCVVVFRSQGLQFLEGLRDSFFGFQPRS